MKVNKATKGNKIWQENDVKCTNKKYKWEKNTSIKAKIKLNNKLTKQNETEKKKKNPHTETMHLKKKLSLIYLQTI